MSDVTVNLGSPGSVLKLRAIDAATGDLLSRVSYSLFLADADTQAMRGDILNGEWSLPLPIVPFGLTISASGYKPMSLKNSDLPSGKDITETITLKRFAISGKN